MAASDHLNPQQFVASPPGSSVPAGTEGLHPSTYETDEHGVWHSSRGMMGPGTLAKVDTGHLAKMYSLEGSDTPEENEAHNAANSATRYAFSHGYMNPRIK